MTNQQILKNLIDSSDLEKAQKELWRIFIGALPESVVLDIAMLISEDSENLKFLTRNLESKIEALRSGDTSKWDKIIEEEMGFVK